jgi:hypothetical protein
MSVPESSSTLVEVPLNALVGVRQFVEPTSDHYFSQKLQEMMEVRRQSQNQRTKLDGLDPELQRRALAE